VLFEDSPGPGLVGIARMASQSELLEAKSRIRYFELPARSLLNRTRPGMPFAWTINPYRGCEFGCKYCYARYTHEFMGMDDGLAFEEKIYAKAAPAELLKRELKKIDRREGIAIGTATDPYQPAERRYRRTQAILEVFAHQRGRRISITTKSDLVARDAALLREVARYNVLHVNITITTLNEKLARILEPRAPRPDLRLGAVQRLAGTGISVGVYPSPVLPLITDREASLEAVARAARDAGARHFGGGPLFLMPCAQKVFLPFLERHFPHLARRYRERYERSPYLDDTYKQILRERLEKIRNRYGLSAGPVDYEPEAWEPEPHQGELFPLLE